MKVLFLSTWFPCPPDNGSKLRVYHLLRALTQKHAVTLVSFAFGETQPDAIPLLAMGCERVEMVPCNPFERSNAAWLARFASATPVVDKPLPEMAQAVGAITAATSFDAVIASTTGTAAYALAMNNVVRVLEEHNSHSRLARERYQLAAGVAQRGLRWLSWRKAQAYEAGLYRQFDLCTMVSEEDRQITQAVVGDRRVRIETVPNGVDCEHNRPGLAATIPGQLVFNGSLTYDANFDAMQFFLAEIYPRLRREMPDVRLDITGAVAGVNLAALALDEHVRLTGFVDDVRLPVARAQVCVVPLRRGGGTRLKILEAMALGTPVVSTPKGAEGLDVIDGEHLLLADTPAAFAEQTLMLLRSPELRHRLAHSARQLVEQRYDWRQIGAQFTQLVEAVDR